MKQIDEIVSTHEVVERIRFSLRHLNNDEPLSLGKVAGLLQVSEGVLSKLRTRNSEKIYLYVLKLCARTGLDPMKILF